MLDKPISWHGTYLASASNVVGRTTPAMQTRKTATVAIQVRPGKSTVALLTKALDAATQGKTVLLTAKNDGSNLMLHAE